MNILPYHNKPNSFPITRKEYSLLFPFFIFYTLLTIAVSNLTFFWDKDIIFSKTAFWLIDHKFSLILPDSLDTGYPPLLGYLLALAWKITGKNLVVMHFLMFPFSIGIVIQLYRFLRHYMPQKYIFPVMILVLADTTLLTQSIIFSTDLVMIFFLLLSINSIIENKRILLSVAVIGLFFSHMRGAMGVIMVGMFDLYKNQSWKKPLQVFSTSLAYLPGVFLFASYFIFHYITKGWIGYHENSPWIGCFEVVDWRGFFRNIFIVAWRLVDFGKLFIVLALFYLAFRFIKGNHPIDNFISDLLILLVLSILAFVPISLAYKVLNSHRYFIPITMLFTILAGYMLFNVITIRTTRIVIYCIMLFGLLSGNFWTYPDTVAKGWDATLAHIPYYSLRNKMLDYIDSQEISFTDIGTEVPNNGRLKYYDLSDDERYIPIKDFKHNKYIFYSNVYNMFTDEEIAALKKHWIVIKEYRCLLIRVTLYKNPSCSN